MKIFIVLFLIVLIIEIICILYRNNKYSKNGDKRIVENKQNEIKVEEKNTYFPTIQIIENNELIPSERDKISSPKIKNALATIDNTVLKTANVIKNVNTTKEIVKDGKVLFSADAKDVKNLMESTHKGKFYGVQINEKTKKITGQTKLTKETKLTKDITKQQLTSAGMNAMSMVVGQYYMDEINDKLEEINKNISNISDFLETRYTSDIKSIVAKIYEIVENQAEILDNAYSRDKNFDAISKEENLCVKLLGQANDEIKEKTKNKELDYKNYLSNIKEIEKWYVRQQLLQEILLKIGDLKYVLAYGNQSSKLCHTQYNIYLKETNNINNRLEDWHKSYINRYKIDIDKKRKQGNLLQYYTIGQFNDDWKYNKIQNDVVKEIIIQMKNNELKLYDSDKKDEIIKIQKYNDEYYNLPEDKNNDN